MAAVIGLCWSLALILLVGAGFATIVGAISVRDRFLAAVVCVSTLALLLPVLDRVLAELFGTFSITGNGMGSGVPSVIAIPFAMGHVALGVVLVRRRRRGAEGARREAAELEQAIGRERPRLSPDGEESE